MLAGADRRGICGFVRCAVRGSAPVWLTRRSSGHSRREFLEREQVLPLFLVEGVLTVAVVEPANLFLLDEIRRLTGHKVQPVAATADIGLTLRAYLPDGGSFDVDDSGCDAVPDSFAVVARPGQSRTIGNLPSPARRLLPAPVHRHHGSGDGPTLRTGQWQHTGACPDRREARRADARAVAYALRARGTAFKAMGGIDAAGGTSREGVIRVRMDKRVIELRLSATPVVDGEKVVIRVGDGARPLMRLEKLGFGYETLKQWRRLIAAPRAAACHGASRVGQTDDALLVIGRDGYRFAERLVENSLHRVLPGVNQMRVDGAAGRSRAATLRMVLAQEPDVVMLPEASNPRRRRSRRARRCRVG